MKKRNRKQWLTEQICGRLAYTRDRVVRLLAGIGLAIVCSSVVALAQIPESMDLTQSAGAAGQGVELKWYPGAGAAADHFEIRLYASDLTLVATRQVSAGQTTSILDPAGFPMAVQVRVLAVAADGTELEQTPLAAFGGQQAPAAKGDAPPTSALVGTTNLQVTLDRVNSRLFPYVFVRVTVADTNDVALTNLTRNDFAVYEDGRLQTNDFMVTPPYTTNRVRAADIVFLIDNSGSMGDQIDAIKNNALTFADALAASGIDYRLGLVQFGQTANNGNPSIIGGGLTADAVQFKTWVGTMSASGGIEPGLLAIRMAIQGFNFRPGVETHFLLITDEESNPDNNLAATTSLIIANGVTVHVAVDCNYNSLENAQYCAPGSVSGVSGGLKFPVRPASSADYTLILNAIKGKIAATYVVSYRTDNPAFDCTTRSGMVTASWNGFGGSVPFSYIAGGAPVIQRTPATIALHDQPLLQGTTPTIAAIISDACAPFVQSATLYVRLSGTSNYTSIAMQLQGANLYSAVIPAQFVVTPGLDYYIHATDGQVASTDPSTEPETNPYQLAVLPNQAPVITHVPPASAPLGIALTLPVKFEDSTMGLSEFEFYYRLRGQLLWTIVKITNALPLPTLVVTSFTVPAAQVQLPAIQYYFRAVDNFGVSSTGPAGGADNPYEVPVVSDLVGYWPFDDGSGTIAHDASGNGYDASLFNGMSWVPGKIGGAIMADGSNGYVRIPPIDLSSNTAVSVSMWVNRIYSTTTTETHALLENSSNYNYSTTGFAVCPEDPICNAVKVGVHGDAGYDINCFTPPTSGLWHHLVVIFDKSQPAANEVNLYIDGVLQSPLNRYLTADNTNPFGNNPTYLFSRGGTSLFSAGQMDDLRLYNRVLSASEVQQLYALGNPPAPLAPVITSLNASTPGQVQLQFSGTAGLSYSILRSTDSKTWTVLGTATETSPGQFQFLDSKATNQNQFYRIRFP